MFFEAIMRATIIDPDRAGQSFGVSEAELRKMDRREFIRLYRKKAKEMHPDRGGEHSDFIELTRVYKYLLKISKS